MTRRSLIDLMSPVKFLSNLFRHRRLILQFAQQEFVSRFKGSFLGLLWALLLPLLMLLVYTFVFSVVFKGKWGSPEDQQTPLFALMLLAGLVPFNIFSESVTSSPRLILSQPNLVKRVVFPLEILPVSRLLAGVYQGMLSFVVLLLGILFLGDLNWKFLFFPITLIPLCLLTLGLSYAFAALGVFIRDVSQIINVVVTFVLFLSPVFYPLTAVPKKFGSYLALNPLAWMIEDFRNTVMTGSLPSMNGLALLWAFSFLVCVSGYAIFMRVKHAFADVM